MPIQDATQSQAFASIVATMRSRIVNGVTGAREGNVFIIAVPDDDMPEHLASPGFRLRVFPPDPSVMSGAGRGGYLTERRVDIFVVTASLGDAGGQDDKAVLAHVTVEDSVVDAVLLSPPAFPPWITLVGDLIKHIPGGASITRQLKTNPGLIVSAIPFAITYVPKVKTNRV